MIVTGELPDVGLYFTEQEPLESLHDRRENFPEPLLDHVTLPFGEEPATVALHLTGEPTTTGDGEHDTVVEVVGAVEVVAVPEEAIAGAENATSIGSEEIARIRSIAAAETWSGTCSVPLSFCVHSYLGIGRATTPATIEAGASNPGRAILSDLEPGIRTLSVIGPKFVDQKSYSKGARRTAIRPVKNTPSKVPAPPMLAIGAPSLVMPRRFVRSAPTRAPIDPET